jgi:hypothetical protein
MEHLRILRLDPDRPDVANVLLDLSDTVSVPDSDALRALGDELNRLREILRLNACAVLVMNDHLYGMSRMFLVFAREGFRASHVFRTIDNAERWLDSYRSKVPAM